MRSKTARALFITLVFLALPAATHDARADSISENEEAVRLDLCTLVNAEWAYRTDNGYRFAVIFAPLTDAPTPYLTGDWNAPRHGYTFTLGGNSPSFYVVATPTELGITGSGGFYADATGAIRFAPGAAANYRSPLVASGCLPSDLNADPSVLAMDVICSIIQAEDIASQDLLRYLSLAELQEYPYNLYLPERLNVNTQGYALSFALNQPFELRYTISATPLDGQAGLPSFVADQSGHIRQSTENYSGEKSDANTDTCLEPASWTNRMSGQIVKNQRAARRRLAIELDAEYAYHRDKGCFAITFSSMTNATPAYLNGDWSQTMEGYNFVLGGTRNDFTGNSNASTYGTTGHEGYYTDSSGVVRFNPRANATSRNSPYPLQYLDAVYPDDAAYIALQYTWAMTIAQARYFEDHNAYASTLTDLSSTTPPYLNGDYSLGLLSYRYSLDANGATYTLRVDPLEPAVATRHYFADESGLIRQNDTAPASLADPLADGASEAHPPMLDRLRGLYIENQINARARLCAIHTAQLAYFVANNTFADTEDTLVNSPDAALAPRPTLTCEPYHYTFTGDAMTYTVTATPDFYTLNATQGTGAFGYFIDESGVLRQAEGAPASAASALAFAQCSAPVVRASVHSADQNADDTIALPELLRVIQFFNSGGVHCDSAAEDGYAPGPGDRSCPPYAADYNPQEWHINLSELLRIVQFYNAHAYHPCPNSEDGFCPGPA